MSSAAKPKIRILLAEDGATVPEPTVQCESHADTLSRVKKEMAKPRVAKSARLGKL
jgi:hypothetical protein